MTVEYRFLRYVPAEAVPSDSQLRVVVSADTNQDFQVDNAEAERIVVRTQIMIQLRQLIGLREAAGDTLRPEQRQALDRQIQEFQSVLPPNPPSSADAAALETYRRQVTEADAAADRLRQRFRDAGNGALLEQQAQEFLNNCQTAVDSFRRTSADLDSIYNGHRSAEVVLPRISEVRWMDANGDRTLAQEEVAQALREYGRMERLRAHTAAASRSSSGSSGSSSSPDAGSSMDASAPPDASDASDASDSSDRSDATTGTGGTAGTPGTAATPPPTDEDFLARAHAYLTVQVPERLRELGRLDESAGNFADQIPTAIHQLNLDFLNNIPEDRRRNYNLVRLLFWMRTQLGSGETMLSHERVTALLGDRYTGQGGVSAIDLKPLHRALETMENPPTELGQWLRGFSPHFIVTQAQLEEYLHERPIDFTRIPEEVRTHGALQELVRLAGSDNILSEDDVRRHRDQFLERFRREYPHEREPAPGTISFLPSLWLQFPETQRVNDAYGMLRSMSGSTTLPQIAEIFLSQAAVAACYAAPSVAERIYEQTRTSGILSLAMMSERSLHAEQRAHGSDGLPGAGNIVLSALTSPLAGIESLGHFLFSSSHTFRSRIWEYHWSRDWARDRADILEADRVGALNLLQRVIREQHLGTFTEGIDYIRTHVRGERGDGEALARYLTNEIHIPEMERISQIENTREREEAWNRFTEPLRRGLPTESHGNLLNFLMMPWEMHSGPLTLSVYEMLANTTENHMVYARARSAGADQRGGGGSIFPLNWWRDWPDAEASLDGVYDEVATNIVLTRLAIGFSRFFQWSRMPGALTEPATELADDATALTRARARTRNILTYLPRLASSLPPERWREGGRASWAGYWGLRNLTFPFRFLFPPSNRGPAAERAINEAIRWAEASYRVAPAPSWTGNFRRMSDAFRSFILRQMAQMQAARLERNPNRLEASEYLSRISTAITRRADTHFQAIVRDAQRASTLAESASAKDSAEAIRLLRNVRRRAQAAARLHEVALNIELAAGHPPAGLRAAQSIEASAQQVLQRIEQSRGTERWPQRTRRETIEFLRSIVGRAPNEVRMEGLAETLGRSVARSAGAEAEEADRLATMARRMEMQGGEQHRRNMLGMTFLIWAGMYENSVIEAERANPAEGFLPMTGIDAASAEGAQRRLRRMRGSRALYTDFNLGTVPSYRESPPPPPPPPLPPEDGGTGH